MNSLALYWSAAAVVAVLALAIAHSFLKRVDTEVLAWAGGTVILGPVWLNSFFWATWPITILVGLVCLSVSWAARLREWSWYQTAPAAMGAAVVAAATASVALGGQAGANGLSLWAVAFAAPPVLASVLLTHLGRWELQWRLVRVAMACLILGPVSAFTGLLATAFVYGFP